MLVPYIVHGKRAARFGAMGVGLLCNPLLCCPPAYTTLWLNAACLDKQQHVCKSGNELLGAGRDLLRAATWMPTRQGELARVSATRDVRNHRRRVAVPKQRTDTIRPPGPTNHQGRLACSHRDDGTTSTGLEGVPTPALARSGGAPPAAPHRAQQGATATTWPVGARQSTTPGAPATGTPVPATWT